MPHSIYNLFSPLDKLAPMRYRARVYIQYLRLRCMARLMFNVTRFKRVRVHFGAKSFTLKRRGLKRKFSIAGSNFQRTVLSSIIAAIKASGKRDLSLIFDSRRAYAFLFRNPLESMLSNGYLADLAVYLINRLRCRQISICYRKPSRKAVQRRRAWLEHVFREEGFDGETASERRIERSLRVSAEIPAKRKRGAPREKLGKEEAKKASDRHEKATAARKLRHYKLQDAHIAAFKRYKYRGIVGSALRPLKRQDVPVVVSPSLRRFVQMRFALQEADLVQIAAHIRTIPGVSLHILHSEKKIDE